MSYREGGASYCLGETWASHASLSDSPWPKHPFIKCIDQVALALNLLIALSKTDDLPHPSKGHNEVGQRH